MGCDIHFYVETQNENGEWVSADRWTKDDDGETYVAFQDAFYPGRNYNLFSILADVRNGIGFAGVKTGDGFEPISMPRGVPADACQEYKNQVSNWDGDGHSHSWYTLNELIDYDWDAKKTKVIAIAGEEEVKYSEVCQEFLLQTIPKMAALHEDATKVRCVFFFDN